MSGYGVKEALQESRRGRSPRQRVNLCGSCGTAISETELLCKDCRLVGQLVGGGLEADTLTEIRDRGLHKAWQVAPPGLARLGRGSTG